MVIAVFLKNNHNQVIYIKSISPTHSPHTDQDLLLLICVQVEFLLDCFYKIKKKKPWRRMHSLKVIRTVLKRVGWLDSSLFIQCESSLQCFTTALFLGSGTDGRARHRHVRAAHAPDKAMVLNMDVTYDRHTSLSSSWLK